MKNTVQGEQAYCVLGYRFLLKWDFPEGVRLLRFLYPACRVSTSEAPQARYSITTVGAEFQFWVGGRCVARTESFEQLFFSLEYTVTSDILNALDRFSTIHAGCVVSDGHALLLPGEGGSGKTTLVTTLALNGFSPLGDDVILVDTDTGTLKAYPRGFMLKGGTARWLLQNHLSSNDVIQTGEVSYLRPDFFAPAAKTGKLKYVVFPKYRPETELRLTPLGKIEALTQILSATSLRDGATMDFIRMVKNVEMFSLDYSSRAQAAECLARLLCMKGGDKHGNANTQRKFRTG
jgi:energy-coupling factor transporter ATP-binding protein EcfA2